MNKFKFACPGCKRIENINCNCPEIKLGKNNSYEEIKEMEKFVKDYIKKNYTKRGNRLSVNNYQLFAKMKKRYGLQQSLGLIFHHFVGRMIEQNYNTKAEPFWEFENLKPGESE
ncbi:MAG TPA: hypothetical protein ENI29_15755 [bacterium]|nr:hypothetical protein [bacterium]